MTLLERLQSGGPGAACPAHPDGGAAETPDTPEARTCQRWTLAVVCLATALLLFNVTAPNVALPDMAASLGASFAELQWVLSSYALVLAGLLLAGGAVGDRYGRRLLFLAGLAVFAVGSLVCTVAPSAEVVVAGRVVQGVAAAAIFPCGLALLGMEFSGAARARAIGVWGASVSAAIALGPLLGGVLVQALGWRAQFGAAVLLVLPAMAVGVRHLRESRDPGVGRLDWAGTALLSGALFLAVLVLTRGATWGWASAPVIGGGGAAVVLLVAFAVVEHRVAHPIIAPELLRNRTFVGATVVALVFAAAGFAPLVYITQYLLTVAGSGPVLAGLQIAPFAVASFVVSLGAAAVSGRVGVRATLAGGLLLGGVGLVLMAVLGEPTALRLLPGLVLFGIGAGLVNPTMTVAALSVVPAAQGGMASGVNNAARQFGIAAGIAGFGTLVASTLSQRVSDDLTAAGAPGADRAAELVGSGALAEARAAAPADLVDRAYDGAYGAALDLVFWVGAGISLLGIAVVVLLVRPAVASSQPAPSACTHLGEVRDVEPSDDGCTECLRTGDTWTHLRLCRTCGHVGCCDSSPNRHASAHARDPGHPIVRSFEPGEDWSWCYRDQVLVDVPADRASRA